MIVSMSFGLKTIGLPALSFWEKVLERPVVLRVLEDNESAIKIATKGFSAAMRHLERTQKLAVGFLGDCFKQQIAVIDDCATKDMAADIFTKSVRPCDWPNALELLGITWERG